MSSRINPIRLLAEILLIITLAQAAVMWVLNALNLVAATQAQTLLSAVLLMLLAGPWIYWRSMVAAGRAPGVALRRTPGESRSLGWAVVMTAAAQLLGLALTGGALLWQQRQLDAAAWLQIDRGTERIAAEIKRRLDQPLYGLMGARGMYASVKHVDRRAFQAYVQARDLASEFPGVRGFGFVERVMRADLPRFVAAERADGAPEFAVLSSGNAPDLFVVKYIEPLAPNRAAWGFDMGQEAVRREAIERAVSSGTPALSGAVTLLQDDNKGPGYLYFVPVYRPGAEVSSPQQRQAALLGLLYVPIVASEIMAGAGQVADDLLDFEFYERDLSQAGNPALDLNRRLDGLTEQAASAHPANRRLKSSRSFEAGGRLLLLDTRTTPEFDATRDQSSLISMALSGALASLLLALTVWLLTIGRLRAQRRAERMTTDLDRLARVVQHTSNAVIITDKKLRITWVNAGFERVTGYTSTEALGRRPAELLGNERADPQAMRAINQAIVDVEPYRTEILLQRKNGADLWIDVELQPMRDVGGELTGFMELGSDITDRKKAESERFAVENELRTMLDVFPGYIARSSEDFHYEYANERFASVFGLRPDQIIGRSSRDLLDEARFEETRKRRAQIVNSGQAITFERSIELPSSGSRLDLLVTHFMVGPSRPGGPRKFYQVAIDITDRKHVEQALSARSQELSAVLDAYPGLLARIDDEMHYTYVNERFAALLGMPREEIIGASVSQILGAERAAEMQVLLPRILAGKPLQVERRYPVDGDEDMVVQVSFVGGADAERPGRFLHYAFGVDVTELRQQQQRLASIIDGTNAGTFEWNVQTGELRLSARWAEIAGYTLDELQPVSSSTWVGLTHEEDMKHATALLKRHIAGEVDRFEQEIRVRHKEGHWIWVMDRGRLASRSAKGEPIWMLGTRQDITARKLAQEQLVLARDEAERASRAKSDFLSSMSHELRTPMNAILGFGQILEIDHELSEEQHDNVEEILRAGRHLLSLINEVLDLAKIESGHIELSLEPVELCGVVEECLSLVGALAAKGRIELLHTVGAAAVVRADRTRLKQVLLNLLSNAIKYNREGGRVTLEVQPVSAKRWRISVRDTGRGIPAERLTELFQPFHRLDAEGSQIEGTGIGLTIARRLVEMMGGTVQVESEIDVGSCFWIDLPQADLLDLSEGHEPGTQTAAVQVTQQGDCGDSNQVLYIEDNPSNIRLVTQILAREHQLTLHTATTPELGIELARTHRPALILLDINLPGMDGYQVLSILKQDPLLSHIPVVALTANAMPRDIERGRTEGFADYLTKPLQVVQFMETVQRHLAQSKNRDQEHQR